MRPRLPNDIASASVLEPDHWASRPAEQLTIEIPGGRLKAYVDRPSRKGRHPVVLFVNSLGRGGRQSHLNLVTACRLAGLGIASVLFDLARQDGRLTQNGREMDAFIEDLAAVFAWAQAQEAFDSSRIGIAGAGLGAAIAARAQAQGRVQPAAMLLSGPSVPPDELRALTAPVLVLIGSNDRRLAILEAVAAGSPLISLSVIEGAGHSFTETAAAEEAARRSALWFKSLLQAPTVPQ